MIKLTYTAPYSIAEWVECQRILEDFKDNPKDYLEHPSAKIQSLAEKVHSGYHLNIPKNLFLPEYGAHRDLMRLYREMLQSNMEVNP